MRKVALRSNDGRSLRNGEGTDYFKGSHSPSVSFADSSLPDGALQYLYKRYCYIVGTGVPDCPQSLTNDISMHKKPSSERKVAHRCTNKQLHFFFGGVTEGACATVKAQIALRARTLPQSASLTAPSTDGALQYLHKPCKPPPSGIGVPRSECNELWGFLREVAAVG